MSTNKYVLEITKEHLEALLPAIDMAARLHIGQLGMVSEYLVFNVNTPNKVCHFDPTVMAHLGYIKHKFFKTSGLYAGYGIHSEEVNESARLMLDVHDVIRHKLAWEAAGNPPSRRRDMYQVYYDPVRQLSEAAPLPKLVNVSGSKESDYDFLMHIRDRLLDDKFDIEEIMQAIQAHIATNSVKGEESEE